jgi:hypothetical protein
LLKSSEAATQLFNFLRHISQTFSVITPRMSKSAAEQAMYASIESGISTDIKELKAAQNKLKDDITRTDKALAELLSGDVELTKVYHPFGHDPSGYTPLLDTTSWRLSLHYDARTSVSKTANSHCLRGVVPWPAVL